MKLDKYLVLSWKKVLIIVGAWVLSLLLHKAIYARLYDYLLTEVSLVATALFIVGTVVIPSYCLISVVYTLIRKLGYDKFLLLSRRTLVSIPAWVLLFVLSDLMYAAFYDPRAEPNRALWLISTGVINLLANWVVPLYLIVSVVYTVVTKAPRDRRGIVAIGATILALLSTVVACGWTGGFLWLAALSGGTLTGSDYAVYLLGPWGIVAILVALAFLAFRWATRPQRRGG